MKKIIIIIIAIVILVSAGFIILFTPQATVGNHDYETVEIQGKVIDIYTRVEGPDSSIIIISDDNNKICDKVYFMDVINKSDELIVSSEPHKYRWVDFDNQTKYNNWLLWCKACNGRYIIIDHVNNHVFITLSYSQMKIGAVFLLLIVIIIILLVKIKRLQAK